MRLPYEPSFLFPFLLPLYRKARPRKSTFMREVKLSSGRGSRHSEKLALLVFVSSTFAALLPLGLLNAGTTRKESEWEAG